MSVTSNLKCYNLLFNRHTSSHIINDRMFYFQQFFNQVFKFVLSKSVEGSDLKGLKND